MSDRRHISVDMRPTAGLSKRDGECRDVTLAGVGEWQEVASGIKRKIAGYRGQDVRKRRWNPENVLTVEGVWGMLEKCEGKC